MRMWKNIGEFNLVAALGLEIKLLSNQSENFLDKGATLTDLVLCKNILRPFLAPTSQPPL